MQVVELLLAWGADPCAVCHACCHMEGRSTSDGSNDADSINTRPHAGAGDVNLAAADVLKDRRPDTAGGIRNTPRDVCPEDLARVAGHHTLADMLRASTSVYDASQSGHRKCDALCAGPSN